MINRKIKIYIAYVVNEEWQDTEENQKTQLSVLPEVVGREEKETS